MKPIVFNGKFLTVAPTGVHRVAEELIQAFERLMVNCQLVGELPEVTVAAPTTAERKPALSLIRLIKQGFASGLPREFPWEQINLPWIARNALLINLCNMGPIFHPDSLTMIHDAQVYLTPASYSLGFRLWYRLIQPLLGRTNRRILTVSEYSKVQLVRYGIAPAEKITVIYNGCDHVLTHKPAPGFVAERGLERGGYVVALSSTQAHKNIRVLFKAFSDQRLSHLTLVLFGATNRETFENLGFEVPANVRFVGRINDAELSALMVEALAFACPSTTEGFGLPPLEAMILGCPSIISPCGALPEVCGDAALQAAPHTPDQWVEQVLRLADDQGLQARLREKGRQRAGLFTWDTAARKLAEVIGLTVLDASLETSASATKSR
ncbi:glycosyltransferase family 4 protein [Rhizobium glycinendophyticum]|uniref:Glycosyltransferase family 4 protein n=1 Tax=Rhizobium glycinendophyticum TaxID=2589807 RepID=A0A504TST4_9HYPH|nr:glycosyltransferase family 1 protein [Rhizobium glycinendophyticum]TPP05474.1 glycosyltransferase family 4 protein [Rhizobium glycinendophyticum]